MLTKQLFKIYIYIFFIFQSNMSHCGNMTVCEQCRNGLQTCRLPLSALWHLFHMACFSTSIHSAASSRLFIKMVTNLSEWFLPCPTQNSHLFKIAFTWGLWGGSSAFCQSLVYAMKNTPFCNHYLIPPHWPLHHCKKEDKWKLCFVEDEKPDFLSVSL